METGLNSEIFRDLFDQVYVINLPDRIDRKNEILAQLKKIGLSFESPLVQLFPAVRPEDKGAFPSVGARGCFLSHLGVLRNAIEARHKSILILEDDVDWTPAALAAGGNLSSVLKGSDWDFLHGGLGNDAGKSTTNDFCLNALKYDESIMLAHFVGMRGKTIALAHNYLEALLGRPPGSPLGGPMHVDGAYNWLRREHSELRGYVCLPSIARQRPSTSDITPATGFKALPVVSHVLAIVRTVRKRFKK